MVTKEVPAGLETPRKVLGQQLAVGFGLVSVVTVLMYALLLVLVGEVSGHIRSMRQDEGAIRESLTLATTIREQYMHQAHWILERDKLHRQHLEEQDRIIRKGITELRPNIAPAEIPRLDRVQKYSEEMAQIFDEEMVPAVESGDQSLIPAVHRRIRKLSESASLAADTLARAVEGRMVSAHVSATKATNLALVLGGLCVLLVILLSVAFTLRLKQAVLRPLDRLAKTARSFGAGDFASRVGIVGEGELLSVAQAFDSMAEELQQRERRLVQSERMAAIGQLAAGVAHEINNPIGIIRGYLKTMGPDSTAETLKSELAILDEEAAHCQRIAEDLLSYTRLPNLQRESVDMKAFLTNSVGRFREVQEDAQVLLRAEDGSALADPGRLRQVLLNLLQNAAQASDAGGQIEVEGRALDDESYEITVLDRGRGVEEKDRARIFEPFFTKRSGGSGLGLSVCQGLVMAHGGSLKVESRPGGGSIFRMLIPIAVNKEEERP